MASFMTLKTCQYFGLISKIKNLLDSSVFVEIRHIFHKQNKLSDNLARLGFACNLGVSFFVNPPDEMANDTIRD